VANKVEYCKGCAYNTPKTKGGYGRLCNGSTIIKHNRCPEWRINEARDEGEYDRIKLRKEVK